MKKSRLSEEQVVAQGGATTKSVCAANNISEETLYNWKRKYQGMEVSDVRTLWAMTEEISRLKPVVIG